MKKKKFKLSKKFFVFLKLNRGFLKKKKKNIDLVRAFFSPYAIDSCFSSIELNRLYNPYKFVEQATSTN